MEKCTTFTIKIILGAFLISAMVHHIEANKKKKVVINVPTHVKHVYHHHLKTIHIQQPKQKEHHIHHEHYDGIHHDRDDFKSKRLGKGFGSWRGLQNDNIKYSRDYRGYSSLSHERPPPLKIAHHEERPPSISITNDNDDYYGNDDYGKEWKPMNHKWREDNRYSKYSSSSYDRAHGVVYEPKAYARKSKRYEGIDLTYGSSNRNTEQYKTNRSPAIIQEIPLNSGDFLNSTPKINRYGSTPNNNVKPTTISFNSYYIPPLTTPSYQDLEDYGKRIGYTKSENIWNSATTSPINIWTETTTNIPSIIPSIWPDLKNYNNWNQNDYNNNNNNNNYNVYPHNTVNNQQSNNNAGQLTGATSFVYNNHGGIGTIVQDTLAKPILPNSQYNAQTIANPSSSSYALQVMHHL